jgi:FkbM family methyltransferase
MFGLTVNRAPLFTSYLVAERRAFANDPVVFLDVGARDGIRDEWAAFGDQIKVYGFEPDEEECARLASAAPPGVTFLPMALGASSESATLYETALSLSSGLHKTRMEYFNRFLNRDNGIIVGERTIAVHALDDVVRSYGIAHVDFIKLDAEGAELDILKGGRKLLAAAGVLGVLSEIRLHPEINGSPPFSALDTFLREHGFHLFDLAINRHSRMALPYPGLLDWRLPSGKRFFAYTTRGQLQDGDALYFRDPLIDQGGVVNRLSPVDVLKLCALMEVYSLSDCAAELLMAQAERLKPLVDVGHALDLLATGIHGSPISYRDYLDAYFADPTPTPDAGAGLAPSEEAVSLKQRMAQAIGRFVARK